MNRFKGLTQHISERLASIFQSPKKKSEVKEPIKESIRDRLAKSQKRADELNTRRRAERDMLSKHKQQNIELGRESVRFIYDDRRLLCLHLSNATYSKEQVNHNWVNNIT